MKCHSEEDDTRVKPDVGNPRSEIQFKVRKIVFLIVGSPQAEALAMTVENHFDMV